MSLYRVSHHTAYVYGAPVIQSNHLLHLSPRVIANQRILSHELIIDPALTSRHDRTDYFGNPTTLISLEEEHTELSVHSLSEIEVRQAAQPPFEATTPVAGLSLRTPGSSYRGRTVCLPITVCKGLCPALRFCAAIIPGQHAHAGGRPPANAAHLRRVSLR